MRMLFLIWDFFGLFFFFCFGFYSVSLKVKIIIIINYINFIKKKKIFGDKHWQGVFNTRN